MKSSLVRLAYSRLGQRKKSIVYRFLDPGFERDLILYCTPRKRLWLFTYS